MKQTKIYDYTTRALMALLVFFFVAVSLRIAVREIVVEGMGLQGRTVSLIMFDAPELVELPKPSAPPAESTDTQMPPAEPVRDRDGIAWATVVDWKALYPAPEAPQPQPVEPQAEKSGLAWRFADFLKRLDARLAPFEKKVAAYENDLDAYATDYAVGYDKMVELANAYDALLGWDIADINGYNQVIELEENYFFTCYAPADPAPLVRERTTLAALCEELGMGHLFVETPTKVCREDSVSGVLDFYNPNADRLLAALAEKGIAAVDLREKLHAAGMDHHESFFQTDHHWKGETGLWAAGEVARELNDRFSFSIDLSIFDLERFERETYEDWFLGSQGKKVTLARATPEEIALLYPKDPVDLSIEIPSLDVSKRGDFSIMYRYACIDERGYYNKNPYEAYFYGDHPLTRVTNHRNAEGKRILVLGHSMDNSVLPFLSLGVSQLDSIDLRHFDGSLETYLRENHYDVVVELYSI